MNQKKYRVKVADADWFQQNIKCQYACPVNTGAHQYISLIAEGKFEEAYALNRIANVFPVILGRICTHPCEAACRRGEIDEPVSICALKRFVADWMLKSKSNLCQKVSKSKSQRVAVIGAGPAGLTAAHDLALLGYKVTVFEALPVVGGMLRVGIPPYRLPKELMEQEILAIMRALGVQIKLNTPIGKDIALNDLIDEFDAVFIATGAHQPIKLGIEGEDLEGVYYGVTFMRLVNLGEKIEIGNRVVVIGGSFTAIDCARSAVRMGASEVSIVYRRTGEEMPAGFEEIDEAEAEGIQIQYLISPIRILSSDGLFDQNFSKSLNGKKVTALECVRNRLGEPDSSGRRRPIPIEGSQFIMEADTVIPAISQSPDTSFLPEKSRLELSKWDTLKVDAETFMTNLPGVFAGGDFTTGPRNVIEVISDGHKAAASIDKFLAKKEDSTDLQNIPINKRDKSVNSDYPRYNTMARDYDSTRRQRIPALPHQQRLGLDDEVELGFSEEMAKKEAKRCLKCYLNIHIDADACVLCGGCVDVCPYDCIRMVPLDQLDSEEDIPQLQEAKSWQNGAAMILDERRCIRCSLCKWRCPTEAIITDTEKRQ